MSAHKGHFSQEIAEPHEQFKATFGTYVHSQGKMVREYILCGITQSKAFWGFGVRLVKVLYIWTSEEVTFPMNHICVGRKKLHNLQEIPILFHFTLYHPEYSALQTV